MKQIILGGFIFFICIISQSCGTDCSKEVGYHTDCGCPSDQTVFDGNCIDSDNYTYYFGLVDFYCFQDSIAIGVDIENRKIQPYSLDDVGLTSYGMFDYSGNIIEVMEDECSVDDNERATFIIFNDKSILDNLPSQINLDLYLKESAFFGSNTIDSTQITVTRR
jgi:hypothetical protein